MTTPDTSKEPEEKAPEQATPNRLESDKDVFEKILERSRAPERTEEEHTPEPEPEKVEAKEQAPEVDQSEVEKARNFLQLTAKVPKEMIESSSPEQLVNWRAQLLEREANINKAFSDNADLRAKLEELEQKLGATTQSEQSNGLPTDDVDLTSYAKAFVDKMGFDEEAVPEFEKALRSIYDPLNERLRSAEEKLGAQGQHQLERMVSEARSALAESFPELSDEATWKRVYATADEMAAMPRYQGDGDPEARVRELIEAAARLEGLQNGAAKEQNRQVAESKEQREAKADAQTVPASSGRVDPKEMTPRERDWAYFNALTRNSSTDRKSRIAQAQRAAGIIK